MIQEMLKPGKENAVSTQSLISMLGVGSIRELRSMVSRERRAGAVILSSCSGGYYLPADPSEVEAFIRTKDKEARAIMASLKSARQYMKRVPAEGQLQIEA